MIILIHFPSFFFTPAFADGFSLEFELQHISSSLQDSSLYSGRSQKRCIFVGPHPSRYFQVFQGLYQSFGDCTKNTNCNWYNRHFHVPHFFQFPRKVEVIILLFTFLLFHTVVRRDSKVHNSAAFFFCCWLLWDLVVWPNLVICLYLKISEEVCVSFARIDSGLDIFDLFVWSNFKLNSQWITFPHSYG